MTHDVAARARECYDEITVVGLDEAAILRELTALATAAHAAGVAEERARLVAMHWIEACAGLPGLAELFRATGASERDITDKLCEAITDMGREIAAALRDGPTP